MRSLVSLDGVSLQPHEYLTIGSCQSDRRRLPQIFVLGTPYSEVAFIMLFIYFFIGNLKEKKTETRE